MKKLIALVAAGMLIFSVAHAAEIDLSSLSLAELIELQQRVTMAMWETDEWQEVTVPAGVYEVGVDIPAGYWTISPTDGDTAEVCWTRKLNASKTGTEFGSSYAYEQITSPTDSYAKWNNVSSVSWNITEGSYIVVESSSVVFTPFAGHNLGFK